MDDIKKIAPLLKNSEMLVRIDPWNKNSEKQIDDVIEAGAQIVMLPYWKSVEEVRKFVHAIKGRTKTMLLLETKEAVECLDDVLEVSGIDEIHLGLNDLHLSYGLTFMFELYPNGMVESITQKIKAKNIPFGIGGMGRFDAGLLPKPEDVIIEHYRLGSNGIILSRSFCNYQKIGDFKEVDDILSSGVGRIREVEKNCESLTNEEFVANKMRLDNDTILAVKEIKEKKNNSMA